MTVVLTLTGYTPPERFDDLVWTSARIEQSDTESGSFTLLESFDLDPLDADPTAPMSRSFTTELATLSKWYRVVFVDEDGDQSEPTSPVQSMGGAVEAYATADELATVLQLRNPTTEQTAAMERALLAAAGEINSEIGRSDLAGWEVALATEVNLDRAVDHWNKSPFGVLGLGTEFGGTHTAQDSWQRHKNKLAPLKLSWGLA